MSLRTLIIGGHALAGASIALTIWTGCAIEGLQQLDLAALARPLTAAAAAGGPSGAGERP